MDALPFSNVLVIANPIAGRGRGARMARQLQAALSARGAACELHLTTVRGDGRERARRVGRDVDLVVAVGGDGTLNEVLDGLPRRDVTVALLPMGTANVLALDLKLPRDAAGFAAMAARGRTQTLDAAQVNGSWLSFLVCGIGFDARVVRALEARRHGTTTKLHWVSAAARAFLTWRATRIEVEIDGRRVEGEFVQALVANCVNYAGFRSLAQDRKLDDGLFEVYLFRGSSRLALVSHGLRGLFAHFPSKNVLMQRARRVVMRSTEPVPFEVDGDFRGDTPFELVVGSQPFRILVP
jgi:diacylglycerol kinase (ATP)